MIKTVIDRFTGEVLYCRFDESPLPNEILIDKLITEPIEEGLKWFYNFETDEFEKK